MKSAIGYLRVSTAQQATEGISLEAQRSKIEAWAMLNNCELVEVFTDAGISGKRSDNRPGLQAALKAACERGGALVVYSLSRVSRSTQETLRMAEQLEKSGADLVSLSEQIDTTSAAGKMVFRMLAVMAEFERDLISERTKSALAHKKALGQRAGNIAYGFQLAGDGISLVENEQEQKILRNIKRLRVKGYTLQQVADRLNKRGYTTRRGGQWRRQYIHNLSQLAA